MSSARKRAAVRKAENEADSLRQQLILANHHRSMFENISVALAKRVEELEAKLKARDSAAK